jgi:hypothetical protein
MNRSTRWSVLPTTGRGLARQGESSLVTARHGMLGHGAKE